MSLTAGDVLQDRYEILRIVKSGGMGAVYEASDRRLAGARCAVKEMLDNTSAAADDPNLLERKFREEMEFLAHLDHPNIPKVRDFFVTDRLYIVMDFIHGDNLEDELRDYQALMGHPTPPTRVVEDARVILDVLDYIHNLDPPIIHRDIKPANIIRAHETQNLMVVDFGLARYLTGAARSQTLVGTLGYCPMEQLTGRAGVRSDLYALGATMQHLLTGEAPTPLKIRPTLEVCPTLEPHLAALVDRACAPDSDDRFASAREMALALIRRRDGGGETAPPEAPESSTPEETVQVAEPTVPLQTQPAPSQVPAGGILLGGLLLIGIGWFLAQLGRPPAPVVSSPPPVAVVVTTTATPVARPEEPGQTLTPAAVETPRPTRSAVPAPTRSPSGASPTPATTPAAPLPTPTPKSTPTHAYPKATPRPTSLPPPGPTPPPVVAQPPPPPGVSPSPPPGEGPLRPLEGKPVPGGTLTKGPDRTAFIIPPGYLRFTIPQDPRAFAFANPGPPGRHLKVQRVPRAGRGKIALESVFQELQLDDITHPVSRATQVNGAPAFLLEFESRGADRKLPHKVRAYAVADPTGEVHYLLIARSHPGVFASLEAEFKVFFDSFRVR